MGRRWFDYKQFLLKSVSIFATVPFGVKLIFAGIQNTYKSTEGAEVALTALCTNRIISRLVNQMQRASKNKRRFCLAWKHTSSHHFLSFVCCNAHWPDKEESRASCISSKSCYGCSRRFFRTRFLFFQRPISSVSGLIWEDSSRFSARILCYESRWICRFRCICQFQFETRFASLRRNCVWRASYTFSSEMKKNRHSIILV